MILVTVAQTWTLTLPRDAGECKAHQHHPQQQGHNPKEIKGQEEEEEMITINTYYIFGLKLNGYIYIGIITGPPMDTELDQ